jgi:hypothetical protein
MEKEVANSDAVYKLRAQRTEDDALARTVCQAAILLNGRQVRLNTPKYWGFSKTIYQKLMEKLIDEEYQAYRSVNGIDLTVKTEQLARRSC